MPNGALTTDRITSTVHSRDRDPFLDLHCLQA